MAHGDIPEPSPKDGGAEIREAQKELGKALQAYETVKMEHSEKTEKLQAAEIKLTKSLQKVCVSDADFSATPVFTGGKLYLEVNVTNDDRENGTTKLSAQTALELAAMIQRVFGQ